MKRNYDDNDDGTCDTWTSTPSEHKGLHDVRQGEGLCTLCIEGFMESFYLFS